MKKIFLAAMFAVAVFMACKPVLAAFSAQQRTEGLQLALSILERAANNPVSGSEWPYSGVFYDVSHRLRNAQIAYPDSGDWNQCTGTREAIRHSSMPNIIFICERFAGCTDCSVKKLAQLLIHEAAHVANYSNECDASKIEIKAMRVAGEGVAYVSSYVEGCGIDNGLMDLFKAARFNDTNALAKLLKNGANADAKIESGITPLLYAIIRNHFESVKLLLEHGVNVEEKTKEGITPLTIAVSYENADIISLLLDYRADIEANSDAERRTPLSIAAKYTTPAIVKLLLDRGAAIEALGEFGYTPLTAAVSKNNVDTAQILLDRNVYIEAKTKAGNTPLVVASYYGNLECAKLLITHHADVGARNATDGETALLAAASGGYYLVMQELIDGGADVHARYNNGMNAIMTIASLPRFTGILDKNAPVDAIKFLLKYININDRDKEDHTALWYAQKTYFGYTNTLVNFIKSVGGKL